MGYKDKKKMVSYINEYNAKNYDRFSLMLDGGQKEEIRAHAIAKGETVNSFIKRAIKETIERDQEKGAGD